MSELQTQKKAKQKRRVAGHGTGNAVPRLSSVAAWCAVVSAGLDPSEGFVADEEILARVKSMDQVAAAEPLRLMAPESGLVRRLGEEVAG